MTPALLFCRFQLYYKLRIITSEQEKGTGLSLPPTSPTSCPARQRRYRGSLKVPPETALACLAFGSSGGKACALCA
ncbi:MAG: hypothetical protein J2P36_34470, partial [Ktedonobacteraceae bacterium]|nr:hypothetical protein [Ktedonobacteraceae bacterium]